MRTDLEDYLLSMIAEGMAIYANGNVESPTGYFAVVITDSEEVNREYCKHNWLAYPSALEADTFYYVVQTSTGSMEITLAHNYHEARRWFEDSESAFYNWMYGGWCE